MKWLIRILIFFCALLLAVAILAIVGIWLAQRYGAGEVAEVLESKTGYELSPGETRIDVRHGLIRIQEAALTSPPGVFPTDDFVQVKQFELDLNWAESNPRGNHFVFDRVIVDIPRLAYVKNKDGVDNLQLLLQRLREAGLLPPATAEEPTPAPEEQAGPKVTYLIHDLRLRLGEVLVRYDQGLVGRGLGQQDRTIALNFDVQKQEVSDYRSVIRQLVAEAYEAGLRDIIPSLLELPGDVVGNLIGGTGEGSAAIQRAIDDAVRRHSDDFGATAREQLERLQNEAGPGLEALRGLLEKAPQGEDPAAGEPADPAADGEDVSPAEQVRRGADTLRNLFRRQPTDESPPKKDPPPPEVAPAPAD